MTTSASQATDRAFSRWLVTGGAGFIGSHIVALLTHRGETVRVLEREKADTAHLPESVEIVRGDITRIDDVKTAVEGCDVVIHCAANPNLWARDAEAFERVNHQGARRVLEAASEAKVKRFVHVSSEAVLAGPADEKGLIDESAERSLEEMAGPYSRSKWLAERAVRAFHEAGKLPAAMIAVPTVPVGPGDRNRTPPTRLIAAFLDQRVPALLAADLPLIDVRDAAAGIVAVADRGEAGARYLVAGENWSTHALLHAIGEITGQSVPRWGPPYPLALASSHMAQGFRRIVGGQPLASVEGVRLTRKRLRFDDSHSRKKLRLTPRPVAVAVHDAVKWLDPSA
jgi:dihydroflavonol-4-reductase